VFRRLQIGFLVVALVLPLLPLSVALAGDPKVEDVTKELMCQCGCGMTVPVCASSMECLVSSQITDVTSQQLAEGRSKSEIISYFIGIYGEKVRSTPTKSGFSVTAWVTPFVAVTAGIAIVGRLILLWQRPEAPAETPAAAEMDDDALRRYEQLVEQDLIGRELKDFQ